MVPSLQGVSRNLRRSEVSHVNHTPRRTLVKKRRDGWSRGGKRGGSFPGKERPWNTVACRHEGHHGDSRLIMVWMGKWRCPIRPANAWIPDVSFGRHLGRS